MKSKKINLPAQAGKKIKKKVIKIAPKIITDAIIELKSSETAETAEPVALIKKASLSAETFCPYCLSPEFVKRGLRKKKFENIQLYICRNPGCGRTFSSQFIKGKRFPLSVIIEGMSYYNLGFNLEETCSILRQKNSGAGPEPATLSSWVAEYKSLCRYERLRPYAIKMCQPKDTVEVVTLAHRQLYRFRYHRPKMALMLQEFVNRRFYPLKEYLDNVSSETPHQYFQEGERMSEIRSKFDKAGMIIRNKFNYANKLAAFVLEAVQENKDRHEALERFMIANDSVTVATEVPVYIRKEDIEHMENELDFKITDNGNIEIKGDKMPRKMPKLITGHIDLVQVRNGQIHLLDYKPKASKEKPVEQLVWYAMALSRLTGLRLFDFKCGWFDDKDFYEFYPLHAVKKLKIRKNRKFIRFKDGTIAEAPRENILKVV